MDYVFDESDMVFFLIVISIFQVKILNSATNRINYTVTVITENLVCDHKELLIYGEQNIPNMDEIYQSERLHFVGNKKIIRLDSSSVNNGQNECVFRHICEDICHYVFIFVKSVPEESNWRICEVIFD